MRFGNRVQEPDAALPHLTLLHEDFLRRQYLVAGLDAKTLAGYYRRPDRRFLLGTLGWRPEVARWVYDLSIDREGVLVPVPRLASVGVDTCESLPPVPVGDEGPSSVSLRCLSIFNNS